jgi:hypothetical protein
LERQERNRGCGSIPNFGPGEHRGGGKPGESAGGFLTVGNGETAATLTVTAASVVDTAKSGTVTVTVTGTPGGGNTDPKTLVITGIPVNPIDAGGGIQIGIFPAGTTREQAFFGTGVIADASSHVGTISVAPGGGSSYTATAELYVVSDNQITTNRWTGSGTYSIYWMVRSEDSGKLYGAPDIPFTSATTLVDETSFSEIVPPGGS